jgi:thioredoxin:protein disulfide reductase
MNSNTNPTHGVAGWLRGARAWASGHERLLWAGGIAVVLLVQWPMVKGFYYRAADTPAPPTSIAWRTDLGAALVEARHTQRQVLVDFSAGWCPPCIAMKHDVWPDPDVERAITTSYVPVLIDVDRDGTVPERYGVRGIPTILVLDDAGHVVRRATFLSASAMVEFLTETD